MEPNHALGLLCQASDYMLARLEEPALTATREKMQMAARTLAQAIAPKPVPSKPAPIVNPTTGESAADFPTEEPEVSDGDVA